MFTDTPTYVYPQRPEGGEEVEEMEEKTEASHILPAGQSPSHLLNPSLSSSSPFTPTFSLSAFWLQAVVALHVMLERKRKTMSNTIHVS